MDVLGRGEIQVSCPFVFQVKDKNHIERFRSYIKANHPIRESKQKERRIGRKDCDKAQIALYSSYLLEDLARFNIVPRKTKIYTFPEWLVQHSLVNHFMRGYFDGDGCWNLSLANSRKTPQLRFIVLGTPKFLETYRSILEKKCDLAQRTEAIDLVPGIGRLAYGGNGIASKIRDFLYKDATVFLQRKFDLADSVTIRPIITSELLIRKMLELGQQKKIAKDLGYSETHIKRNVKKFDIANQMMAAKANYVEIYAR